MAGSEQEGVEGARADLFEGAVWVLTPDDATSETAYTTVRSAVSSLGAEVVAIPPTATTPSWPSCPTCPT